MKKLLYHPYFFVPFFFILFFLFFSTRDTHFVSLGWAQHSVPEEEVIVEDTGSAEASLAAYREAYEMWTAKGGMNRYGYDPNIPLPPEPGPGGGDGGDDTPEDPCADEVDTAAKATGELAAWYADNLLDSGNAVPLAVGTAMDKASSIHRFANSLVNSTGRVRGNLEYAGIVKALAVAKKNLEDCREENSN